MRIRFVQFCHIKNIPGALLPARALPRNPARDRLANRHARATNTLRREFDEAAQRAIAKAGEDWG